MAKWQCPECGSSEGIVETGSVEYNRTIDAKGEQTSNQNDEIEWGNIVEIYERKCLNCDEVLSEKESPK